MQLLRILTIICFIIPALKVGGQVNAFQYTNTKHLSGKRAAVVSAHPLASQAGVEIMKAGGNAFDAAIAVQLALAVVYPGAGNIGGGGFLVAYKKDGTSLSLDFREMAPGLATRDMYLDSDKNIIDGLSLQTRLASGVPGTVAGIFKTLAYAKLPLKVLIAPAIRYAEKGFVLTEKAATSLNSNRQSFLEVNKSATAFTRDQPWKTGDTLIQKELAATLKRISDNGIKEFYSGQTARLIVEEMKKGNGIISMADLQKYEVKQRIVLRFPYKGCEVLTMSLPSAGGVILQQLLKMTEHRQLEMAGFHSPRAMQLMIEAERRAYADRSQYLGDPDFVKVPLKKLLSDSYLNNRLNDVVPNKAGNSNSTGPGLPPESKETTHISILDKEGNAISLTTTLNDSYGSKVVVTGAGFILNNEMDDFSIKAGVPNMYGAVGSEANAIEPGKRILSSMAPAIVLKNKKPYIIVGTPGGTSIPTSNFQTIVNLMVFKLTPADAVNSPKFHHQWLPDIISVEQEWPAHLEKALRDMGYTIKLYSGGHIGRTELIVVSPVTGKVEAVADFRGDDDARGY
jgi:gamma-glutamyltranspeptidase/glutathione hydrolase